MGQSIHSSGFDPRSVSDEFFRTLKTGDPEKLEIVRCSMSDHAYNESGLPGGMKRPQVTQNVAEKRKKLEKMSAAITRHK
jgi:hypothetical protein